MSNIFKDFNEKFFSSKKEITWYDYQGVFVLDENILVTITLDDRGTRDNYNGYHVEIYNKANGKIANKFFEFRYHLEMTHREKNKEYYHAWFHSGSLEWYISRPKNTKDMVNTLFDWISKFK